MIDLEQLKADREAGTDGPWEKRFSIIMAIGGTDTYSGPVWGGIAHALPTEEGDDDGRYWSAGGSQDANARRIARLPELEAAYIEVVAKLDMAVEALQEVDDTLAKLSGSLAELDAALLAQEIAVIALERDNIAALISPKPERDE